jgi:hypothetical protein
MGLCRPCPRPARARLRRCTDPHRPTSAAGAMTGFGATSVASLRVSPSVEAPSSAMAPPLLPATPTAAGDVKDHGSRDVGEALAASASASTRAAAVLLAHRRSDPAIGGRRGPSVVAGVRRSPPRQDYCGAVSAAVAARSSVWV